MDFRTNALARGWHLANEFVLSPDSSPVGRINPSFSSTTLSEFRHQPSTKPSFSGVLPELKLVNTRLEPNSTRLRPAEIELWLNSVTPAFPEWASDPQGNYTVQTLIHSCSPTQRLRLLQALQGQFSEVACHPRGTHTVQALAALCSTRDEELLFQELLQGRVLGFARHPYGNHVLRKLLGGITQNEAYLKELAPYFIELAKDKHGVCVVKTIISQPQVTSQLLSSVVDLMQDPYGNYAVQSLLELGTEEVRSAMLFALRKKVLQLSTQKYSSKVIEACLTEPALRTMILEELLNPSYLEDAVRNPYTSFILKSALRTASDTERAGLVQVLLSVPRHKVFRQLQTVLDQERN